MYEVKWWNQMHVCMLLWWISSFPVSSGQVIQLSVENTSRESVSRTKETCSTISQPLACDREPTGHVTQFQRQHLPQKRNVVTKLNSNFNKSSHFWLRQETHVC